MVADRFVFFLSSYRFCGLVCFSYSILYTSLIYNRSPDWLEFSPFCICHPWVLKMQSISVSTMQCCWLFLYCFNFSLLFVVSQNLYNDAGVAFPLRMICTDYFSAKKKEKSLLANACRNYDWKEFRNLPSLKHTKKNQSGSKGSFAYLHPLSSGSFLFPNISIAPVPPPTHTDPRSWSKKSLSFQWSSALQPFHALVHVDYICNI